MEFGISIRFGDIGGMVRSAVAAESLGFDVVWVPDSQVLGWDAYVMLALFSRETDRIKLGVGVTNPVTRDVTVTSRLALTLNTLSKGRFILGLGVGDSGVKLAGLKPATIDSLSKYVDSVRKLCNGDVVNRDSVEIRMHTTGQSIPIYLAATGKKSLRLAGKKADGVIINVGLERGALLNAIQDIHAGAEQVGRDFRQVKKVCLVFCCYSEYRLEARNAVKPLLAFFASTRPEILRNVGFDDNIIARLDNANKMFNNDIIHATDWDAAVKAVSFLDDSLVDKICISGDSEDFIRQLRELEQVGVDEVFFRPFFTQDPGLKRMQDLIRNIGERVIPVFSDS